MLIELTATVSENDEITLHLPSELRGQTVNVRIQPSLVNEQVMDERPWTEVEIKALLDFHPVPAEAIVTGGWEDMGITDSQDWVEEQRRSEQEQRGWQTYS